MKALQLLPRVWKISLWLSLSLIISCGSNPFSSKQAQEAKKKNRFEHADAAAHQDKNFIEGPSAIQSSPGSLDYVAEPVPVAGAYLNCKLDNQNSSNEELGLSCLVRPAKMEGSKPEDMTFDFFQGAQRSSAQALNPSRRSHMIDLEQQLWVYSFAFARSQLVGPSLFVESLASGSSLVSVIRIAPYIARSLLLEPVHLGDDAGVSQDCPYDASQVSRPGVRTSWNFEVTSAAAPIDVRLESVCGIDSIDVAETRLELVDAAGVVLKSLVLGNSASPLSMGTITLELGSYSLRLEAYRPLTNDHDDFLVRGIRIDASQGSLLRK